jgi:hypothetical protein
MDRQYIDDNHIVPRYLADQLTDTERAAFEAYYLEHPEILREIDATARFKAGLAQLQASGELAALMKPTPWYARGRYLAVAAIVIIIIAAAFYIRTPTPPLIAANLSALVGPTTVASSHVVLRRRGSLFDAEVTLPAAADAIELRVLPEFAAPNSHYRIALARIDANNRKEQLAEIKDLTANSDGMVRIYLDSPRIAPGDYSLIITNDTTLAASRSSQFLIRISR